MTEEETRQAERESELRAALDPYRRVSSQLPAERAGGALDTGVSGAGVYDRRFYTATFLAAYSPGLAVTFVTVPGQPLHDGGLSGMAESLGVALRDPEHLIRPSELAAAIQDAVLSWRSLASSEHYRAVRTAREEHTEFMQRMAYAPIVPFENSPLGGHSLASLVAQHRSGAGLGAAVGVLTVGGDSTPVLIVSVPLGVIIVGAALGISRGLASGLEERIHRWLARESGELPDAQDESLGSASGPSLSDA